MRTDLVPWAVRGAGFAAGAVLVVAAVGLALSAAPVLLLVFVAILLGSALEPFIGWFRAHVPIGRGPTILLVYAAFLGLVVGLALLILPTAVGQLEAAMRALPTFLDEARTWAARLRPAALATSVSALIRAAESALSPPPPDADAVVEVGITVAEIAASISMVLALVFFWLVEHARLQRYALAFLPARRRRGVRIAWNAAETRLGLWVRGQLTLMAAIGLATGVAYSLLGVPSALLLGLIAAVCEAIPIVGPLLGAVPAILISAAVSPELALAVGGIYIVLQVAEGQVLVPIVMRNTIGISPFLVIVSLLIGGAVGGIPGAFLAVPTVAAMEVVLERLQARRIPVAQDPPSPADDESVASGGSSSERERPRLSPKPVRVTRP